MTVQERQMAFAYALALEIVHEMERVRDFAWQSLSHDSMTACVDALEKFRKVSREMEKFMHDNTDFQEK